MTYDNDDFFSDNDLTFRHFSKSRPIKQPNITQQDKYINSLKFINYKCNPKHLLLLKRYRNEKIDKHEYIACHFLSNELIDTHLDRLSLGHRVETNGHSQWHFRRSLIAGKPDEAELYFQDNFSQLFSNIIDLDTGKKWKYEEPFSDKRFDLLYKKPLIESASIYTTDLMEALEPYTCLIPDYQIEHENNEIAGYLQRGMFQTTKPHITFMLRQKGGQAMFFIILDSSSCKVIGVITKEDKAVNRAYFYKMRLEHEDFTNKMV